MCPICSIGVVAGLGLSRWLRVDDSVTGIWIGALLLGLSIWTYNWLFRKREKKPIIFLFLIIIVYGFLTFGPLYATGIINNNCKTIFGVNNLVFGSISGVILLGLAFWLDKFFRWKNDGGALFPYQKVIIPLAILMIASYILNICG